MMEVDPGIFVSTVDTDDWTYDPETGGEMHVLYAGEDGYAGLSRFLTTSDVEVALTEREFFLVLEGTARIEINGGPVIALGPGEMASIPKGAETRWSLTLPYKEMWFFSRAYE